METVPSIIIKLAVLIANRVRLRDTSHCWCGLLLEVYYACNHHRNVLLNFPLFQF